MKVFLASRKQIALLTLFNLSILPAAIGATAPPTTESTAIQKNSGQSLVPDEADQLITNRRLRASSGSLSKFSVSTTWSYSAGAVNAPFSVMRPNITAAGDTAALQSLSGDVGVRYRINTKDSVSLSIGLSMLAPFHYSIDTNDAPLRDEFNQNAQVLTANDPTLTYRHLDKFGGVQSVSELSASLYTASYMRNAGFRSGFTAAQTFMYEVGKSGLSVGTTVQGSVNTFDGDVDSSNRPGFVLGFYPALEYTINDSLNVRTVAGLWVNEFRRNGTSFNRIIYQSVGLGISVARNVFLYPNIQFLPGDLRADKTNIGFSANVNIL